MINDIDGNAAAFSKSLNALANYATGSIEKAIRKACIDLYRRIVERTPLDTGRAKANWQMSTTTTATEFYDKDGYSFNEINEIVSAEISDFTFELGDDQVFIYNNLEYIQHLESGMPGGSQQAPIGMVAVSLVEFTSYFNEELAKIEGLDPV